MVTAARVGPRWIDPDRVWAGTGRGSATPAEENGASEDCQIDRFHNHENMSPEALAQAVAQLQASLAVMTDRVAALETAEETTLNATRRLGMDVIELAGALARRVRALEQPASPPDIAAEATEVPIEEPAAAEVPPALDADIPVHLDGVESTPPFLFVPQPAQRKKPANGLAVALGFLLALALAVAAAAGGLWYYRSQSHPLSPARKPAAVAPAKLLPKGSPTPALTPKPAETATQRRPSSLKHESDASASTASKDPTGHLLYGVSPAPEPTGAISSSGSASTKP